MSPPPAERRRAQIVWTFVPESDALGTRGRSNPSLLIREDDLRSTAIARLLQEHLDHMHEITPAGSVYALDLDALRKSDVTFWSAWDEDELLGCGALRAMDDHNGEIKSMRTAEAHRGKGVASAILRHVLNEARERGYRRVYLETGPPPGFSAALGLYARHGFSECGPFGPYQPDPHSVFMVKEL